MYRAAGKRAVDLAASLISIAVLSPVLIALALLIRLRLGRPILFRQTRPGRGGKPFQLIKFRTMIEPAAGQDPLASDGQRLTRLGSWLRRASLDELPELLNVVRGEMSLIGPRPLLVEYLGRYSSQQARRHEIAPGITGWAQVHGRNDQSWEKRFALDVWYVDHRSLGLDLKILFLTVIKVLRREGVAAPGHPTMKPFEGCTGACHDENEADISVAASPQRTRAALR